MTKFVKGYETGGDIGSKLPHVLDDLGLKWTYGYDGTYGFNSDGGIGLVDGTIKAYIPIEPGEKGRIFSRVRRNKGKLVIDIEGGYRPEVSIITSPDHQNMAREIFKRLELAELGKQKKRIKWEFEEVERASRSLFENLDEMGLRYTIRPPPREEKPEFYHGEDGDYLVNGVVQVEDRDISFNLSVNPSRNTLEIYGVGGLSDNLMREVLGRIEVERVEVEEKEIKRFGGREIKISGYTWDDVGGLEDVKQQLREVVEYPLKNPALFSHLGIRPSKGIILYGPPGTGKTLLAKVVASETDAYFLQASSAELTSMWYGQSSRLVKELFETAREHVPSIVFIDEIDGLFPSRSERMHEATRRMSSVFLEQLDGLEELMGVVILAATNRIEDLDPAIKRSGRFERLIEVSKPDPEARRRIFEIHTRNMPLKDIDYSGLVELTEGCSGADIEFMCYKGGYIALERYMDRENIRIEDIIGKKIDEIGITQEDFYQSIQRIKMG